MPIWPRMKEGCYYGGCWGKTWEDAENAWAFKQSDRMAADQEEMKRRDPKVTHAENDGEWLDVEFTRDNGERVSATYKRSNWLTGPAEVQREIQASLERGHRATGPVSVWTGSKELGPPQPGPAETPRTPDPSAPQPDPDCE